MASDAADHLTSARQLERKTKSCREKAQGIQWDELVASAPHKVSGMLLYARTDEAVQPDGTYQMNGNRISVRTLDLNRDFTEISAQFDAIAAEHFGGLEKRPA